MQLSEAIALGRTLVRPTYWTFLTPCMAEGCAIGMGLAAIGYTWEWKHPPSVQAEKEWPWLMDRHPETGNTYRSHISVKFYEVGQGRLTLDQLIDWVRANEPKELLAESRSEAAETVVVEK